jgi:hypothetical protein
MPPSTLDWDWVSVIGTGQSLAVGGHGDMPEQPFGGQEQRFGNLKLSLGSARVPPLDPTLPGLALVPLTEPLRPIATTYPSAYPENLYGQSFHHAMADQITTLVRRAFGRDYVTIHTSVGEAGQAIGAIAKGARDTGTVGRAYAGSLFEVAAIARLAATAGKRYGVGAIVLTHGESDADSHTFADDMAQLQADYDRDLAGLTGQTTSIPLFLTQQHSRPAEAGTRAVGTVEQWRVGVAYAGRVVCLGPKYQYDYVEDDLHLTNQGYERLGEKHGQAYVQQVVHGALWRPLAPVGAVRQGHGVVVHLHVPVPPLTWDERLPPHPASGRGRGFELRVQGDEAPLPIDDVRIEGDSVRILCARELPAAPLTLGYAMTAAPRRPAGSLRWGALRDSDPFVGSITGTVQQNYCVSFEIDVPSGGGLYPDGRRGTKERT